MPVDFSLFTIGWLLLLLGAVIHFALTLATLVGYGPYGKVLTPRLGASELPELQAFYAPHCPARSHHGRGVVGAGLLGYSRRPLVGVDCALAYGPRALCGVRVDGDAARRKPASAGLALVGVAGHVRLGHGADGSKLTAGVCNVGRRLSDFRWRI